MAKEYFKNFNLEGEINISLKVKGQATKHWSISKALLCQYIIDTTERFANLGYRLTLRQLYYQLVAAELIPNHLAVYKKLGKVKDDLAYGGLLDWAIMEDRGRKPQIAYTEINPVDAIRRTHRRYNLDKQEGQLNHIEVWSEKDAISGILSRVTRKYTVPLVINKGYSGSTAMYEAYRRFVEVLYQERPVKVIYFGDHDPSGLDMVRDIFDRTAFMISRGDNPLIEKVVDWYREEGYKHYPLEYICEMKGFKLCKHITKDEPSQKVIRLYRAAITLCYIKHYELLTINHLGLTMEQIKLYNPPENPAKVTDPRAVGYIKKFGKVSWEVDALSPEVMHELLEQCITGYMDMEKYQEVLAKEKDHKKQVYTAYKFIAIPREDNSNGANYLRSVTDWLNGRPEFLADERAPIDLIGDYEEERAEELGRRGDEEE